MLQVTLTNDTAVTWTVNGKANGDDTVGTITTQDLQGTYSAPPGPAGLVATITATSVADTTKSASATVYAVPPGIVTTTGNVLVASYSIIPPSDAQMFVQFGPDTTYGRATSNQETPQGGGAVSTYVAGMHATSLYHMQGVVQFADGTQFFDADQTFTTGALPHLESVANTVTTTPGLTPQPGIEMLDLLDAGSGAAIAATDLDGSVIWYNPLPATNISVVQPIHLLPNGHFLITMSPPSTVPLAGTPIDSSTLDEIREVDLANNVIRSINVTDLNTRLTNAGFTLNALVMHHDSIQLPNGHWIILVAITKDFLNLSGYPAGSTTTVLGDAIIDLDTNLNPVWVWNSFDHLDINRRPENFPDWLHSNALLYTEDGNLLLSIRHQNWIIKIDYENGKGSGDVIWHLGPQGDFTLVGGTDPTDWFTLQHGPAFYGPKALQTFDLLVMDNGDGRQFPAGETCAQAGFATCPFSAVPMYRVDESAMTATLIFDDRLSNYNYFGGNTTALANGNIEFDLCSDGVAQPATAALVTEVTNEASPQVVWQMMIANQNAYRAFRVPSLYPGVQW
jgi:arylsulfate sulfotransferase